MMAPDSTELFRRGQEFLLRSSKKILPQALTSAIASWAPSNSLPNKNLYVDCSFGHLNPRGPASLTTSVAAFMVQKFGLSFKGEGLPRRANSPSMTGLS